MKQGEASKNSSHPTTVGENEGDCTILTPKAYKGTTRGEVRAKKK